MKNITSHINENRHIYADRRNQITLALWGIALLSHAVLMPMLIRELYDEFAHGKVQRTGVFG